MEKIVGRWKVEDRICMFDGQKWQRVKDQGFELQTGYVLTYISEIKNELIVFFIEMPLFSPIMF